MNSILIFVAAIRSSVVTGERSIPFPTEAGTLPCERILAPYNMKLQVTDVTRTRAMPSLRYLYGQHTAEPGMTDTRPRSDSVLLYRFGLSSRVFTRLKTVMPYLPPDRAQSEMIAPYFFPTFSSQ